MKVLGMLLVALLLTNTAFLDGYEGHAIVVGMGVMRKHATAAKLPVYPRSSLQAGSGGRVVIEIRISMTGNLSGLRIIESPDQATALAVREAVKKWHFQPFRDATTKEAYTASSRLVFYFQIVKGKPIVVDAAQEVMDGSKQRTQ